MTEQFRKEITLEEISKEAQQKYRFDFPITTDGFCSVINLRGGYIEGRSISLQEIENLRAENEKLKSLTQTVECPRCGENLAEPVWEHPELVQWVYDRDQLIALRAEVERLKKENADRNQLALEFADYLENERWKYDHKEQKTHTVTEHWEYFKQISKH